jgi:hypothetical protein
VLERHAPRERDIVALVQADALVGIEAEVKQQLEDPGTIVRHRDPQQPAGAVVLIAQFAFRVPRAEPIRVPERRRRGCGQRSAATEQQRRDMLESPRVRSKPPVRGDVQRREIVVGAPRSRSHATSLPSNPWAATCSGEASDGM